MGGALLLAMMSTLEARGAPLGQCLFEVLGAKACEKMISGDDYVPGVAAGCDAVANELSGDGASLGSAGRSELFSMLGAAAPELEPWIVFGEVVLCMLRPRLGSPRYERQQPPPLTGDQRAALSTVFGMYDAIEKQDVTSYRRAWHVSGAWTDGEDVVSDKQVERWFRRTYARKDSVTAEATCSRPVVEGREAALTCTEGIVVRHRGKKTVRRGVAWFSLVRRGRGWAIVRAEVNARATSTETGEASKALSPYVRLGIGGIDKVSASEALGFQELGVRLGRGFGPTLDLGAVVQQHGSLSDPELTWVDVSGKLGAGLRIHPPWSDVSAHAQGWGTVGHVALGDVDRRRITGIGFDVGMSTDDESAPLTLAVRYGVSSIAGDPRSFQQLGVMLDVNPR